MNVWENNLNQQAAQIAANNAAPKAQVGHTVCLLPHGISADVSAEKIEALFPDILHRVGAYHTVTQEDLCDPERREIIERAAKSTNEAKQKFWPSIK